MNTPELANSVRLTGDAVEILDRRVYPFERTWVRCTTSDEVAQAIKDMVTQSSGPLFATTAAMVLAARAVRHRPRDLALDRSCAKPVPASSRPARPTTTSATPSTRSSAASERATWPRKSRSWPPNTTTPTGTGPAALGRHAADLLPDGATVLTHCWADYYLIATVQAAQEQGNTSNSSVRRPAPTSREHG